MYDILGREIQPGDQVVYGSSNPAVGGQINTIAHVLNADEDHLVVRRLWASTGAINRDHIQTITSEWTLVKIAPVDLADIPAPPRSPRKSPSLFRLTQEQKDAVWRRYVEGLSYLEIATDLGISPNAAKGVVNRILSALSDDEATQLREHWRKTSRERKTAKLRALYSRRR